MSQELLQSHSTNSFSILKQFTDFYIQIHQPKNKNKKNPCENLNLQIILNSQTIISKKKKRKKKIPDQRKLFFHHLQHQAQPNAQTNGSALSLATSSPAQSATPPPSQKFDKQIKQNTPTKIVLHFTYKGGNFFAKFTCFYTNTHKYIYIERGVKRGPVEVREGEGCAADQEQRRRNQH